MRDGLRSRSDLQSPNRGATCPSSCSSSTSRAASSTRRWRSGSRRRSRPTSTTTGPCTSELVASGELVESEVLAGPDLAKIVTSDGSTAPVVTDGPFQEFKEWLAGYQIVDVDSEARAIEIAAQDLGRARTGRRGRSSSRSRSARSWTRRRRTRPRWRPTSQTAGEARAEPAVRRRGPAARAGAAGPRRARPPVRATSTRPRTPCRRRCSRPPATGRATASRQPARLADPDRHPPPDRPAAQRAVPTGPREPDASAATPPAPRPPTQDDTLTVLFMCCHPSLTPASAIALTLRAVGGLTTAEIASAFLVPEATMAQRICRAKRTHQGVRRAVRHADPGRAAPSGLRTRAARPLPHLQRGLRQQRRSRAAAHRPLRRGHPAGADGAPAASRRRRGRRPARAHAAHRRPPPRPDGRRRAT